MITVEDITDYDPVEVAESTNKKINYEKFKIDIDDKLREILNDKLYIYDKDDILEYMTKAHIKVSTVTLIGKFSCGLNTLNIARHIDLDKDAIISVKYGNPKNMNTNRRIVPSKKRVPKKKKKKIFYNQLTLEIQPDTYKGVKNNPINMKISNNGSIQMTGCKSMHDFRSVVEKFLIYATQTKQKIMKRGEVVDIEFIKDYEDTIKMVSVKVVMINSDFKIKHLVNRDKLYYLLCTNDIQCVNSPVHACVNVVFMNEADDTKISIFVFQSGSIIITGAKNYGHIVTAHDYIMKILNYYRDEVFMRKVDKTLLERILTDGNFNVEIY